MFHLGFDLFFKGQNASRGIEEPPPEALRDPELCTRGT